MKSPQGRESKKPKKPKVKSGPKVFEDPTRKAFQVPQAESNRPDKA
ncbi:MAG: hypothetical protein WCF63_00745 [Acidimicrobiales bacterium]|jgi:hypothetical protein